MHRMQRHCLGVAAAIAGLTSAGIARAEPHLFNGKSFVDFLTPFEPSNPGRIADVFGSAPASFEVPASVLAATLSQLFGSGTPATRLFSVPIGGSFGEAVATMHGGSVGFTTTLGEQRFVGIGKLTLHFVPEPAALLLLGSGLAGLALLHRLVHRG